MTIKNKHSHLEQELYNLQSQLMSRENYQSPSAIAHITTGPRDFISLIQRRQDEVNQREDNRKRTLFFTLLSYSIIPLVAIFFTLITPMNLVCLGRWKELFKSRFLNFWFFKFSYWTNWFRPITDGKLRVWQMVREKSTAAPTLPVQAMSWPRKRDQKVVKGGNIEVGVSKRRPASVKSSFSFCLSYFSSAFTAMGCGGWLLWDLAQKMVFMRHFKIIWVLFYENFSKFLNFFSGFLPRNSECWSTVLWIEFCVHLSQQLMIFNGKRQVQIYQMLNYKFKIYFSIIDVSRIRTDSSIILHIYRMGVLKGI